MTVLIRTVLRSGEARTVGRLVLDRGSVVIEADPTMAEFLRRYGCVRPGRPDLPLLSIADGEPWLRALPFNLRGTYLWAEASRSTRTLASAAEPLKRRRGREGASSTRLGPRSGYFVAV